MMKNKFVILFSLFLLLILGLSLLPDSKNNTTPAKQKISGVIESSLLSDNTFKEPLNSDESSKITLDLVKNSNDANDASYSTIADSTAANEIALTEPATTESNIIEEVDVNYDVETFTEEANIEPIDSTEFKDTADFEEEIDSEFVASTEEAKTEPIDLTEFEDSIAFEGEIDSEFDSLTEEPTNESIKPANDSISSSTVNESSTSSLPLEPSFSEPITDSRSKADILTGLLVANYAVIDYANAPISISEKNVIDKFCGRVSARLKSVSSKRCADSNHRLSPFESIKGNPIVVTEFAPKAEKKPLGRVLIIGGTHGDELTSVSTAYEWISKLNKYHSGLFHWHIAPSINPDGLIIRPATRTNANGIDINRNLPTSDWDKQSVARWEKASRNKRRNPGETAGSELESRWIMHEIATFKPDAIISIHAPYGVLDFDSPELKNAPKKFGRLKLNLLGTYPGSLGNYAGIERQIPVLTLELPNATAMPEQDELDAIWIDMIRWLKGQF